MSWYRIKVRPADKLFSTYIRARDGWRCVYGFKCNRNIDYSQSKGLLDCSHFQKRRKESVRFDIENCDASCRSCHYFVENHPEGQKTLEEFKRKQLGEKRFNALLIRANQTGKKDDKLAMIYIKQLMKELSH